MSTLHLDFETRSEAVLKGPTGVGAAKYAMHPTTQILCMSFSVNNGPTRILERRFFKPGEVLNPVLPEALRPYVNDSSYIFTAHNAFFEECIWEYVLHQRYGWPSLHNPKRWACTMAKAAMCGLPLSLDKCGIALRINSRKDAVLGKSILNKMSVPCKWDAAGKVIWNEDPALFEDLYRYCIGDVDAEKEIDMRLPELPPFERKVWEQDFIVNHRGIHTDVKTAKQAMNLAAVITDRLNRRLDKLTLGQVSKATQLDEMKLWLQGQGEKLESLDKAALRTLLARKDLPELIREVIYIRSQVGKSSTSKYKAVVCTTAEDGRVRGALQYHGAGTGRWVGRRVQFQNLPMGTEADPLKAIEAIQAEDEDWFEMLYPKPMETLSSTIRGISLTAPEGKKLLCADYAGIEVAVLMWVAGQEDALNLLRSKQTLYIPMANYIYKRNDISKHGTPVEYKVGKETILGCFEANTLVLTKRGWTPIIGVNMEDQIWDGIGWVKSDGVIYRGERDTICLAGIGVTPEHRFLTPEGKWVCASQVLQESIGFLKSMIDMAASGLLGLKLDPAAEYSEFGQSVPVASYPPWHPIISEPVSRHDVMRVLKNKLRNGLRIGGGTPISSPIMAIGFGSLTASPRLFSGVTTPKTRPSTITEGGAYRSLPRGEKTDGNSLNTSYPLKAGMTRPWRWIVGMLTGVMSRAIFGSLPAPRICPTGDQLTLSNGESSNLKRKSHVYDILNCGPRTRFVVLTNAGPLIAHNSGFGMWWPKFLEQCEKKGISLGDNTEATENTDEYVQDIAAIKIALSRGMPAESVPLKKKTRKMTKAEVRAKEAILAYREKYTRVPMLWSEMELAAKNAIKSPQNSYPVAGGKVVWGMDKKREFLCCLLPSGRCLRYYHPFIKMIKTPWGKEREEIHFWGEGGESKHWGVQKTYGGSLTENVIQALARDIMAHGMLNCEAAGFPIVLTVHDELIAEILICMQKVCGWAELERFIKTMCILPPWAAGMPIRAEGWVGLRYKK